MELLGKISSKQWEAAKAYFNRPEHAEALKFSRKTIINGKAKMRPYSFVRINGVIYAIANQRYLGSGSYGCVKVAQNEAGENFAIKIEQIDERHDDQLATEKKKVELKILSKITDPNKHPFLKGYAERRFAVRPSKQKEVKAYNHHAITTKSINIIGKRYTITSLIEGQDLWYHPELGYKNQITNEKNEKHFELTRCVMPTYKKLQYALEITTSLKMLHDRGVIHGDLKPDNLIYHETSKGVSVFPIDFGMSHILKSKRIFSRLSKKSRQTPPLKEKICTREYRAPEIAIGSRITPKCDIYSLGIIFRDNLQLHSTLCDPLLNPDPKNRPSCNQIINTLIKTIYSIDYKSNIIASLCMELISKHVKTSDVSFHIDKYRNELHCHFINPQHKSVDFALRALRICFDKHELYFAIDNSSKLNLIIELYSNRRHFLSPSSLAALNEEIRAEIDTIRKASEFFRVIKIQRHALATRVDNAPRSVISNDELLNIYEYLIDYQSNIENQIATLGLGGILHIHSVDNYEIKIRRNRESFTLEFITAYQSKHVMPVAKHDLPTEYKCTLKKSRAFESIHDYLYGSSQASSSVQPEAAMPILISDFKELQLSGRKPDVENRDSNSRASCRSSPR